MRNKAHALMYRFGEVQQKAEKSVHQIYFYDEICAIGPFNWDTWQYDESETSAKHIRDCLDQIPDTDAIEVHINSRGGEVGEGVTIYNLLRQKAAKGCMITGYVDGYAYSVAADIAMACDELHMGLGTSMLLHFPWMYCAGNAEALRAYADQLDALGDAAVQLYMNRAKDITEPELREMMAKETVLSPEDCRKYGFCDFVDSYKAAELPDPKPDETEELKKQLAAARLQRADIAEMLSHLRKPEADPEEKEPETNMLTVTFLDALKRAGTN